MYRIIGIDGQPYGPVSAEQIRAWLAEGRVNGQTLIQPDGASEWKPLSSLPEFAGETKPVPPSIAGPPPIVQTRPQTFSEKASKKIVAGICGIVFGSLGIHKFILGYTNAGIIMLVITVAGFLGGFLTCGLTWSAYGVMHIIGLIEGIIYLTKSDEEFVRTYVDGRKEWF